MMSRLDSVKFYESTNERSSGRLPLLSRALTLILAACLLQPLVAVPAVAVDSFGVSTYTRGAIRVASGQYLSYQFNSSDVTNALTFNASETWSIAFHMNVTNSGSFSNFFTAVDEQGFPVFALGGGTGATVLATYTCFADNTCSSTNKTRGTPAGTMGSTNGASYPYRWEINQDASQVCVNRSTSASFGRDDQVSQDCYSKITSNKKIARIVIGGTPQTDARTYSGAVRTFDISNVVIKKNLLGEVNRIYSGLTNTVQDQYFAQNEYSSPVDSVFLLQTYNTDITVGGSTNYLKNSSSLSTELTTSVVVPAFTSATSALASMQIPALDASTPLITTSGPNTGSEITIKGTNLQGVNKVKWGLQGSTLSNATLVSTSSTEVKFNMPSDASLIGTKNITFAVSTPAGSLSANKTFTYTVGTSTSVSASNLTPSIGSEITLSSTISAAGSTASDASGSVTFKDSDTTLCVDTSITTGEASCPWTPPSASTYTVRAIYTGDSSYVGSTSSTISISVAKLSQTITFTDPSNQAFSNSTTGLSATSNRSLTVAFSTLSPTICSVSGSSVTLISVGTCQIAADQSGNSTYAAAAQVIQEFTVSIADQSITFGSIANKLLGISPFSLVASTSSALTAIFSSTTTSVCTVASGQVTILAVGTCTITANQSGNGNFNAATEQTQSFNVTQIAITYDGNSPTAGTASRTSDSYSVGNPGLVLPTVGTLAKTGYEFDGWATSVGGSKIIGNYTPSSSGTLYARWGAKTFTTSFNINGASGEAPADINYTSGNSGFSLPAETGLSKSGYTFGGWSTTPTGSALSGSQSPSNDQILYAVWGLKTVTATYNKGSAPSNPANFPAAASGSYNSTITLDSGMTDNYTDGATTYYFQGWSDGTSTFKKGDTFRLGADNITLTAEWVAIYGVRYSLGGGTVAAGDYLHDEQCTLGVYYCSNNQSIQANSAPSRSGYNFTGWKDQSGTDIAAGTSFTVSSTSYLLYAQWTAILRTVTYSLNYTTSDSVPTETSKTINQTFATASAPSRSGYTFKGWSDSSSLYGPSATYMVVLSNVTLTAQWAIIPLLAALNPTFSTPTTTTTGFTVQISNYDAAFTWDTATVTSGIVARDSFGLLTVTGLTAGQSSTLTQTTSRAAYNNGTGSVSSNATALLSPLNPTFSAPTSTADGFTVTITNFNSAFTWDTATVTSGIVSVTSTSGSNRLLTVTGLSAGASATITQATSRSLYSGGSGTVSGTAISATPVVNEQPVTAEPVVPVPVVQGPPPSILKFTSPPKISRDSENLYCQAGKFVFLREGRTEEIAKLSTQTFFLMQNGRVVESSESSSEKVAFKIEASYLNTTLSCQIEAIQENLMATGQSLDFEMMSNLSKNKGQAITAADVKYYSDRAAAYSKKAQTFAELEMVKAQALAKVKSSKEEVKIRITYLKAFTAASNLWKQELAQADSNRVIAKALAQKVYISSLELAGIAINITSS